MTADSPHSKSRHGAPRMPQERLVTKTTTAIVPAALLAWGSLPEVAVGFPLPWATIVADLAAEAASEPLAPARTVRLWSALEALAHEAVKAGRADLLDGLDTGTAETLGLSYAFDDVNGRRITIGKGARYTWPEMRLLAQSSEPKAALAAVDRVKALFEDVFAQEVADGVRERGLCTTARVSYIVHEEDGTIEACDSCGVSNSKITMATKHGTRYCSVCWMTMVDTTPGVLARKPSRVKRR